MHRTKHLEFDFEKFNRGATDSDFGLCDESSSDERHSFDGIFAWIVLDIFIDFLKTLDFKSRGADTIDFDAKFL